MSGFILLMFSLLQFGPLIYLEPQMHQYPCLEREQFWPLLLTFESALGTVRKEDCFNSRAGEHSVTIRLTSVIQRGQVGLT